MRFDLPIFFVGAATVIDTALVLSVLERRNLRNVAIPIVMLLVGVWMFHSGHFANLLLANATGMWAEAATGLAMTTMSAGILLMPSALFHAALRLMFTGLNLNVRRRWGYTAVYLPVLLVIWAVDLIVSQPGTPFLTRVATLVTPATLWICAVNLVAIVAFSRQGRSVEHPDLRRFLAQVAFLLVLETTLLMYTVWVAAPAGLATNSPLLLLVVLSPLMPTLLFGYFVVRYRFMKVLLERSIVYGAIVAVAIWFHQFAFQASAQQIGERLHIDLGIIEGICVFLLVLLYQPIRRRVGESLRYLLSRNVTDLREKTRRLAVEMWQHLDDSPQQIVDWFVRALRASFDVQFLAGWLYQGDGPVIARSGDNSIFSEDDARKLHGYLQSHAFVTVDGRGTAALEPNELLNRMQASLAVRLDHVGFSGLLVLGPRNRGRDYSEEETNAILLLVELLGATMHGHYLQSQRLLAERMAAQNEKLGALGMLTSCLAHEIKNPLSSIKTIATVMSEQLGPDHAHAEDLQLILGETDRLSNSIGQFLKFARPAESARRSAALGPVIDGAVHVLSSMARGKDIRIETCHALGLPEVAADENVLREIIFNLLLNAVEAVRRGGNIRVEAVRNGRFVVTTVRDDGPGITAELRKRMFDPFVTGKTSGTGLGLFIVRRHIEQLAGEIECESKPATGTCFTVKLPMASPL